MFIPQWQRPTEASLCCQICHKIGSTGLCQMVMAKVPKELNKGRSWKMLKEITTQISSTEALVFPAAKYCAPVWCRSPHGKEVGDANNNVLRITTGFLKPSPVFYLPVLSGIASAGLRQEAATFILAKTAQKHDWQILHETTTTALPPNRQVPPSIQGGTREA